MSETPPIRYVAFLRAINVGGHVVKMDTLRRSFESLGLARVETFLASGNAVFETTEHEPAALASRIAERLRADLGFEVATFLRSDEELSEVAAHQPFTAIELESAMAQNVAFTGAPLDASEVENVQALTSAMDAFRVRGREVYWLCRTRQSESAFSNVVLEKTLGRPSTLRGRNTVAKMVAKWPPAGQGG